jgi:hypothetical protein
MALALLADPDALPAGWLRAGPVPLRAALLVHQNTVLGALVEALRLSCPTVDRLVGEAFFDHAAAAFAVALPPRRPDLGAYGEAFPDFLQRYGPTRPLPYLSDVARLDQALERAASGPQRRPGRTLALDGASLTLSPSLAVLELDYPADDIRAAIEADDDEALGAVDLAARPRWLVVWRAGTDAMSRQVSPAAGVFLTRLLDDAGADDALNAALAAQPEADVPALLQRDVFAAPFATITATPDIGASP